MKTLRLMLTISIILVSMVAITDGEAIMINDGKRSIGSGVRGIGIRVCVGRSRYPLLEKVANGAPGKERRSSVALIFREASARKPIRLDSGIRRDPAGVWDSGGGWTGRSAVFGSSPQPLGPA